MMPNLSIFHEMLKNSLRMSRMVWKEKRGSVLALAFVFLLVSTTPFLQSGSRALLINELVSSYGSGRIDSRLVLLIAILILSLLVPAVMFAVQNYLSRLFWYFLMERFDLMITQKKGKLDIALHESPKLKDLLNKISEEGSLRVRYFIDRQFFIFQNIIEVTIAAAVILYFKWWLLVIIVVGTFPELIAEARYGKTIWEMHTERAERRRKYKSLQNHFSAISCLSELKLFQSTQYFLETIKELLHGFYVEEKASEKKRLLQQLIVLSVSQVSIAFAVAYFTMQVVNGSIMVGTLTFILASIGDLRQSLSGLFSNIGMHYQDSLFVTDIFRFLDTEPSIREPEKGIVLNPDRTPEIVFEDVTFYYPGTNRAILKNFSLTISPGEKVALVGVNGAGKTTFVKLLCRFYDPDKGRITVDGRNLKEIDLESWYSHTGVLFQNYARYHFIVKEAIAVGRTGTGPSPEMVKEAAVASDSAVFIEEWDKKYDQLLGKEFSGGIEPSIGQWQKLALARIFYRDPRVLILDEPTASIDARAEARIFDRLESLPKDRTVILISHRFSTVRNADKIVILEDGAMKEVGNHEELLKLNGTYAHLFNLQAEGYK